MSLQYVKTHKDTEFSVRLESLSPPPFPGVSADNGLLLFSSGQEDSGGDGCTT